MQEDIEDSMKIWRSFLIIQSATSRCSLMGSQEPMRTWMTEIFISIPPRHMRLLPRSDITLFLESLVSTRVKGSIIAHSTITLAMRHDREVEPSSDMFREAGSVGKYLI